MTATFTAESQVAVLHVGGLHHASEKAVVEQVLGRRPGVISVEANPVAQTASVVYDPGSTSIEALRECSRRFNGPRQNRRDPQLPTPVAD